MSYMYNACAEAESLEKDCMQNAKRSYLMWKALLCGVQ